MLVELEQSLGFAPPALANRPHLEPPLRWYLSAFYDLSRGRQLTMGGAGPIAISEMAAYIQIFGMDSLEDRQWFVTIMGQLDSVYLEHQAKKHALEKRQSN
jgi:hypothetical protein